jgi:hypothetical protein
VHDLSALLGNRGPIREDQLQTLAIEWLLKEFGEDCVQARVNRDEEAYRIHAVIVHG